MSERKHRFYCSSWKFFIRLLRPLIKLLLRFQDEKIDVDGPCIVISNHVTDWDPFLVSQSFPNKQMYFISSEHVLRKSFVMKLVTAFVGLIPRKKGSIGADTVMSCLRHIKAGHSVIIFAEGETSWDGLSHNVVASTGKLVRNSGASLITYRIEGGYLSRPRWSKRIYKGRIKNHPVRVYSPEELKAMSPAEIDRLINSDIFEDAWERQRSEKIVYKNDGIADNIELALFMCPKCGKLGTIHGSGRLIRCTDCGFETSFNEYGFFSPAEPFETVLQWDRWQNESFVPDRSDASKPVFSDRGFVLKEIGSDHSETFLERGELMLFCDRLSIGQFSFPLAEFTGFALVQKNRIMFSVGGKYYELSTDSVICLRKYLLAYEKLK